jgi:hypothetical protein
MLKYNFANNLLIFCIVFNGCSAINDQCLNFGENIQIYEGIKAHHNGKLLEAAGDFNGDGVKDKVVLLSISKNSKFAPDVVVSNPFTYQTFYERDANLTDTPSMALGIIHGGAKTTDWKRFALYNNAVFKEWDGSPNKLYELDNYKSRLIEIYMFYKGDPFFEFSAKQTKGLERDAFIVVTPYGYTNFIFWNGKEYEAKFDSQEEPD